MSSGEALLLRGRPPKRRSRESLDSVELGQKQRRSYITAPGEPRCTRRSPGKCHLVRPPSPGRQDTASKTGNVEAAAQPKDLGQSAPVTVRAKQVANASQTHTAAASFGGKCRVRLHQLRQSGAFVLDSEFFERPVVTVDDLEALNNSSQLVDTLGSLCPPLVSYSSELQVSLGEGGRELLRACLLLRHDGCSIQGASVHMLLHLAHEAGLWPLVQRIVAERASGRFSPLHLAFIHFKALQTRLRKEVTTESMLITRAPDGSVEHVLYEPNKSLQIGKEGRSILKASLCRYIGQNQDEATSRLETFGLGSVALKHATVPQLLAIAWALNQWDLVVEVVRLHDKRRRCQTSPRKSRSPPPNVGSVCRTAVVDVDHSAVSQPSSCDNGESAANPVPAQQPISTMNPMFHSSPVETSLATPGGSIPCNGTPLVGESRDRVLSIDRLLELMQAMTPTSQEARSVARELLKELLRCVRLGVISTPPPAIYAKLVEAAQCLGLDEDALDTGQCNTGQ